MILNRFLVVRQCATRSYTTVCAPGNHRSNSNNPSNSNGNLPQTSNCSTVASRSDSSRWHLYAGLCLQRPPLIGPELNWLERRMADLFSRVELSDSLYSDHEMRHFEDLRRAERITKGVNVEEKDLEDAAKQTAQDFEEQSLEEAKQFQKSSRVTKADLTNNQKSIDRSLDKFLYLTVKHRIGDEECWLLPQQLYEPELDQQSLRQTAERCYRTLFPDSQLSPESTEKSPQKLFDIKFLGNTPCSHYQYRYPQSVVDQCGGKIGSRIFLFKCNLFFDPKSIHKSSALMGKFGEQILQPKLDQHGSLDFGWLTYQELSQLVPKRYWQESLGKALLPDEIVDIEQLLQKSDQKSRFTKLSKRLQSLDRQATSSSSS